MRLLPKRRENLCDDLLFLNGAYAESAAIPARIVEKNLLRLKPQTAFADAALTEPLACVVQGWEELRPQTGQRLLIIGSGPIGLMFAAIARHRGCAVTVAGRGKNGCAWRGDWRPSLAHFVRRKPRGRSESCLWRGI